MIKVLWISNIPSPYKIELMNLLGKKVDLTSYFEYAKANDRDDKWYGKDFNNFKYQYLENKWFFSIIKLLFSDYDILINSDYSSIICILATIIFRIRGKTVILQADGGIPKDRGFIINKLISVIMKLSNCFLSSGYETDKYFNYYGVSENIYHYRFSSLTKNDIENNFALISKKSELKDKNGLSNKKIFLSIGQPIYRKGFDVLIKAYSKIENNNTFLFIVGGDLPEDNKKLIKDLGIINIRNIEFLEKNKLAALYAMSDYFVLATREDIWGLVINEAMSFGLPIISTDKCIAAVEFNNYFNNGIIVPTDNVDVLSKAMNRLLENQELVNMYSNNSLHGIKEYSIENTANDYYYAICSSRK